jgi:UDP-4-amino-4,6-dideoxy-N-acetyl-beta-L-altrosamine N-acetyltransferase
MGAPAHSRILVGHPTMTSTDRREITLIPLIELDTESQLKVRDIRNEDNVRKWMYTDHIIEVGEHLGWINSLKTTDKQIVFAVMDKGSGPLGAMSVNAIDRHQKRADWAYYLSSDARGGLGSTIEFFFIDFVFGTLGMEKLNCEVIKGNDMVVQLHKNFLFQEEGFRRSHIIKDGVRIGVHLLGLTKDEWNAGKSLVYEKYQAKFDKFSLSIEWSESQSTKALSPIDQIEAARARNNLNWMGILRLALEKSPATARPLIQEIRKIDQQIAALTQKLIGE